MKIEKKCKFITAITHVLNAQNPSRNPSDIRQSGSFCASRNLYLEECLFRIIILFSVS